MSSGDEQFIAGFMADYFAECEEHLAAIRGLLLTLERGVGETTIEPAVLEELFRSFHSIKGISGMVELREAEMLAHEMESYLRALRQRDALVSQAGVDALIAGVGALDDVLTARRDNRSAPPIGSALRQIAAVVPDVTGASSMPAVPAAQRRRRAAVDCDVRPVRRSQPTGGERRQRADAPARAWDDRPRGAENSGIRHRLRVRVLRRDRRRAHERPGWLTASPRSPQRCRRRLAPVDDTLASARGGPEGLGPATSLSHYVRVDLARLDALMRNVGDLVISRARLDDTLSRVERRMPAGRVARDSGNNAAHRSPTARPARRHHARPARAGRRDFPPHAVRRSRPGARRRASAVRLELQGQDTEIDKFLIERMMDPVLHLVRNAVSHGIRDRRRSASRPGSGPKARIVLAAATAGDIVVLDIADDGRGHRCRGGGARARGRWAAGPGRAGRRRRRCSNLICAPGFSTRDETDRAQRPRRRHGGRQVDGRGAVGHAAPRDRSRARGTRFVIELPVTLAITDALIAHGRRPRRSRCRRDRSAR